MKILEKQMSLRRIAIANKTGECPSEGEYRKKKSKVVIQYNCSNDLFIGFTSV